MTDVLSAIDRIKLIIAGIAATESEPEGDDAARIAALADRQCLEQAAAAGT